MKHSFFFEGNSKEITWIIQTNGIQVKQKREHPEIYFDKVTHQQSKYIALHVGIFWGIGRFIIKNGDIVTIKIDDKLMYDQLSKKEMVNDKFISIRMRFISQLFSQRKLKINLEFIKNKKIFLEN